MRALEIIRIIAIMVFGACLVFLVQPWLYQSGILFLSDVDPEQWVAESYTPSASIVYGVTSVATWLWYGLALKAKPQRSQDTANWRVLWWIIFLAPVVSVVAVLWFFRESNDALVWQAGMYVLDVLLLYWISTASSSPGHTKLLPPFSLAIRQITEPR